MTPPETPETVLEGVILAARWGPSGEVLDYGLMALDETEYLIDRGLGSDHHLNDYLRQRVRLAAVVQGERVLRVIRIETLAPPS